MMKVLIFSFLFINAFCATIKLKEEAIVVADYIKVKDIVEIKEGEVKDIKIAPSPSLGKEKRIKGAYLLHKLRKMGFAFDIEGEEVRVKRPIYPIEKEKIINIATEALKNNLPAAVEYKFLRIKGNLYAPVKEPEIFVQGLHSLGRHKKVILIAKTEGWSEEIEVLFRIHQKEWVVVASGPIRKGEKIKQEDVCIKEKILEANSFFCNIEDVVGRRAKRFIKKGEIIKEEDLLEEFAVRRGECVKLQVFRNGISIETKGVVYNDARIGERVYVRNIDSKKIVEGILLKKDTVVVQ